MYMSEIEVEPFDKNLSREPQFTWLFTLTATAIRRGIVHSREMMPLWGVMETRTSDGQQWIER